MVLAAALCDLAHADPVPPESTPSRLAYIQLTAGPVPVLLLGPETVLLPFSDKDVGSSELGRRFTVCAAVGSPCVETGGWHECRPAECTVWSQVIHLSRTNVGPTRGALTSLPELTRPEEIQAALDALPEIAGASISASQNQEMRRPSVVMAAEIAENERLRESLDPVPPRGPLVYHTVGKPAPPPPPSTVSWWEGNRVRWELGASGHVSVATRMGMEGTSNWSGGVRVGVGLRLQRQPSTSPFSGGSYRASLVGAMVDALKPIVLGEELTADLRFHLLGSFGGEHAWAAGLALGSAFYLPPDGRGPVAARLPSLLSMFVPEVMVGSWRGDYGLGLMLEWRGSLLVRSSFGLTASVGGGTLFTDDRLNFVLAGIGGFVR